MLLSSRGKDLDERQKYLATFYFSVSSSVNLHAKRIDHAFKTETKTKRANLTKTKQCVLHCLKIIYAHTEHAKCVVFACCVPLSHLSFGGNPTRGVRL